MRLMLAIVWLACCPGAAETQQRVEAPAAKAWNEPDAYRGFAWGTLYGDVRAQLKKTGVCLCAQQAEPWELLGCRTEWLTDVENPPLYRVCQSSFEAAGVPVTDQLNFEREALIGSQMTFPASNYDSMREVFLVKYGSPTSAKTEPVTNAMGALFTNESLVWLGPRVTVTLKKYGKDLSQSFATVGLTGEMAKFHEAEAAARRKKGAEAF